MMTAKQRTLTEIVRDLTGRIDAVGETNTDEKVYDNLCEISSLTLDLVYDIIESAKDKDRHEYSMQRCGKKAQETLDIIKEMIGD